MTVNVVYYVTALLNRGTAYLCNFQTFLHFSERYNALMVTVHSLCVCVCKWMREYG